MSDQRIPETMQGPKRIIRATKFSMEGLASAFKNEEAFRTELFAVMILSPVVALIDFPMVYRLLIWLSMGGVLVAELLNSAVEAVVDHVSPDFHPLAKQAKDMGSAAVFIAVLMAVLAWGLALWEHF